MRQTKTNRIAYGLAAGSFAIATGLFAVHAHAEEASTKDAPLKLSGSYRADLAGTVSGGVAKRGRVLDDLQLFGDLDLDKAVGWKGASAHVELLNNSGAMPNDDAGTLQGVDNIEVSRQRARLFEAWVEQGFGDKGSVKAGLYDLNSEFYANESAGLLLAPAFGIGSELAATGPNGPSIFPSTALAVRARWTPSPTLYAQAAVLNANAGVLGDPGGVRTSFDNGVLMIGEAGWEGRGKIAFGTWRYSQKQDDIRAVTKAGVRSVSRPRAPISCWSNGSAVTRTLCARRRPSRGSAPRTATPPPSRAAGKPVSWSSTFRKPSRQQLLAGGQPGLSVAQASRQRPGPG
jgi:porin